MAKSDEEKIVLQYLQRQTAEKEKQAEFEAKIRRLQGEELDALDEQMQKDAAVSRERMDQLEQLTMTKQELIQLGDAEILRLRMEIDLGKITKEQGEARLDALITMQELSEDQKNSLKERLETEQKLANQKQKQNMLLKGGVAASKSLANNMVATLGFSQGLTFQLFKSLTVTGALGKNFKAISGVLKAAFGPIGFLAFGVTNMFQMALVLDKASAQFAAITGAGRQFEDSLIGTFRSSTRLAISLEQASKAMSDLFVSYVGFTKLSPQARTEMVKSAASLEKIGVNAQTAAAGMNYLEYSLGQTGTEAQEFSNRMARMAIGMGLPAGVLQEQFVGLIPKLSLFADGGVKTFSRVARAARDLGMDLRTGAADLLKMTDGFDEFESAANKVATLNLALGGSFINAFDMVMLAGKPVEQIKMMQDAIGASGKSIDAMNYHDKKFLAQGLGIEMQNLQKLMKGELSLEEAQMTSQDKLAQHMEEAVGMLEKFRAAIQRLAPAFDKILAVLTPVVNAFAFLAEKGVLTPILLGGMAMGFVKIASAVAGLGAAFGGAGTKAAVAGTKFKLARVAALGVGGMAGSMLQSGMQESDASSFAQYLTGGLQFAAGAALTYFTGGIGSTIGLGLMASGGTQIAQTAMGPTPTVSRQGGGTIQKGDSAKVHSGEAIFVNPPNSGSEVIDAKTMARQSNASLAMRGLAESFIPGFKAMDKFADTLAGKTTTQSGQSGDQNITVELYLDRGSKQLLASETVKIIERNYNPDGSGRMSMA